MRLKNRKRLEQDQARLFPVTPEDWRNLRHREDPADRVGPDDIGRALDVSGHGTMTDLDVLAAYEL